jgi:hypothetical protein
MHDACKYGLASTTQEVGSRIQFHGFNFQIAKFSALSTLTQIQ